MFSQSGYTYEYHLKDHLGNVRMTFTTKDETESARATLEANGNNAAFLNYDKARLVYTSLFDHTNGNSPGYAQRLSGSAQEKIGLAKSFSVMPGDKIKAEVYAKYFDADAPNLDAALQALLNNLLNPAGSGGQVIDGSGYSVAVPSTAPWIWGDGESTNASVPEAYLNYIFINRDFDVSSIFVDYKVISSAALEDGSDVAHEKLFFEHVITEPGYVYVYLSNDGEEVREVYFDDFKVEHVKGPVIESSYYYPFGLTFGNYQKENSTPNEIKFNEKEEQDELGLGWIDFDTRMYQPEIGRMLSIDDHASNYYHSSPYSFVLNNPILFSDPTGMDTVKAVVTPPPAPSPTPPPATSPAPEIPAPEVAPAPWRLFLIMSLAVLMQGDTDKDNGTKRLNDDEALDYFTLINKRDHGDGLTQEEASRLYDLENKEMGVDGISGGGGFEKMVRGNNTKKNEEVKSLFKEYCVTDKDDQRNIHDIITGKNLTRDQIKEVVKDYMNGKGKK